MEEPPVIGSTLLAQEAFRIAREDRTAAGYERLLELHAQAQGDEERREVGWAIENFMASADEFMRGLEEQLRQLKRGDEPGTGH